MAGRLSIVVVVVLCLALAFVGVLHFLEYALLYHPRSYPANYRRLLPGGAAELAGNLLRREPFHLPERDGPKDRVADAVEQVLAFLGNEQGELGIGLSTNQF